MKGFTAFFAKETKEFIRTKRMMIILGVFLLVGIMNPAITLLTPKLMNLMADDYAAMGITLTEISVSALDSWAQFAKNLSTALIVFLIMLSGIYTSEYSKGTLIPLLTKGLSRTSVVLSKLGVMLLTWTAGLWLCFGVTYAYNSWYWDNSVARELPFACFLWWLFGVMIICTIVFFSSLAKTGSQVLLGTGGIYIVMALIGMYGKAKKYLPSFLTDSVPLFKGEREPSEYVYAIAITAVISVVMVIAALPLTNKRQL